MWSVDIADTFDRNDMFAINTNQGKQACVYRQMFDSLFLRLPVWNL
jgi:Mg2+/Co2+ transporter CorB